MATIFEDHNFKARYFQNRSIPIFAFVFNICALGLHVLLQSPL